MKRSRRVIALNMFWSLLSLCINYLMNFLITPYVTNNIGVEAYGFVALANTFISYVDILAVGLNAFAGRFIAMAYYQKKLEKANRYFSSTILADLILACVLLAGGTVAIVRLDRMLQIPQELTADVKLLFFIVLMRYLLTLLRTAFDAAAFISERMTWRKSCRVRPICCRPGCFWRCACCCSPMCGMWGWPRRWVRCFCWRAT